MSVILDVLQTVAILVTLGFSIWQWKKTCRMIKIDNYAKIIAAMNELRGFRLDNPNVERALFDSRKDGTEERIRKRVYGVMLANIFEWTFFSYQEKLIDKRQWETWKAIWKEVILPNDTLAELMSDRTMYTFSCDAYELIRQWVGEIQTNRGSGTTVRDGGLK